MKAAGRGLARVGVLAVVLAVGLTTSGCIAAGLAAGPLMSAVQLVGDRSVERTVAAELAEAQGATEAVLARMAFRIESREQEDGVRRLRAVADKVTVHARLERVTVKLTRVGLRVETGGMIPDRDTGAQVHDQIAALLAPTRLPVDNGGQAEALSTLQGEIRKLRSDLEERRPTPPPAPVESGTSMRVEPGAVVSAPMSAALPTVGGPAPSVSVAVPVTAPAPASAAPSLASGPNAALAAVETGSAAPLRPAGALTPIRPATGVGSGK
jgi:hypothetical protein